MVSVLDGFGSRWVEVDLDAICHNLQAIQQWVGQQVQIMAVVKADAYGCGARAISRTLEEQGVNWLAVTTLDEGIQLRNQGIKARILVFHPLFPEQIDLALDFGLTPTVHSSDSAHRLAQAAVQRQEILSVHLKLETGMGRTGLFPDAALQLIPALEKEAFIHIEGIYTHLATAASPRRRDQAYAWKQYQRFQQVIEALKTQGCNIPLRHVCNSAGLLAFPQMHENMVRPGTLLYGQYPGSGLPQPFELRDPWCLRARVLQVQEYARGWGIGYGRSFVTRRPTRVAVLPVGYVDGLSLEPNLRPRSWWDLGKVLGKTLLNFANVGVGNRRIKIQGQTAPLIGKIAMQSCMADVSAIPNVQVGSWVELQARRTTVNPRLLRVYRVQDQPVFSVTADGREYPFTGAELSNNTQLETANPIRESFDQGAKDAQEENPAHEKIEARKEGSE